MDRNGVERIWPWHEGEMADRLRGHDWSETPLGPSGDWPQPLKTLVELMLAAAHPAAIV